MASALAVASGCIGPVLFLLFGTTIGALSSLGVLAPYRVYFIVAGVGLWSYGFYGLYLRRLGLEPDGACGEACERPCR